MSDPNIEPLVDFIVKRDRIARLKAAGKPRPWTDDPHLATKRFTEINVSHDRISRFIYETITRPYADHPNLIGALVFSRLSNEPTVISAALPALFPLNADQLLAIMLDRYERGLRMERDAYLIPALGPGKPKVKNHIEQLLVPLAQSGERLRAGDTVEGVFQRLRQFPILKKGFINAQVVRDAKSVAPLRSASDWETFVWSGPGSRQCTDLLHGYSVEEAITREKKRSSTWDDEDELKWRAKFRTIVNLAKPRVAEHGVIEIEDCQSWQSCLCETSKLIKYRAGHLDGARKYVPYGSPTPQSHEREAKPKPAPIAPPAVPAKPIAPPRPYPRGLFVSLAAPFITPATTKSDGLRRLAFDIETDGLDEATKVHCVVIADLDGDQIDEYGPDQIDAALAHLNRADCLIGHHIAGYDLPLLRRLHSWTPAPKCAVADTLIAARLILPHLDDIDAEVKARAGASLGKLHGRYSLEAFGIRLGIPKIGANIEAWSTWTPEVQARCVGDVVITKALWWFLQPDGYSQQALELEHRVAAVCAQITADGIPFDRTAAERLRRQWEARRNELEAQLRQKFKIKNLNSRLQIARLLEARGWKPEKRTEKTGQPVIDDELLETLPEQYPEFTGLAEHYIIGRRLGQLEEGKQAWLSNVGPDGRIHGGLVHIGTPHSRAKHLKPNSSHRCQIQSGENRSRPSAARFSERATAGSSSLATNQICKIAASRTIWLGSTVVPTPRRFSTAPIRIGPAQSRLGWFRRGPSVIGPARSTPLSAKVPSAGATDFCTVPAPCEPGRSLPRSCAMFGASIRPANYTGNSSAAMRIRATARSSVSVVKRVANSWRQHRACSDFGKALMCSTHSKNGSKG